MLNKCKIMVFPEYHKMGRLINAIDNKQTGRIINNGLFCINGATITDNFCVSSWFWGDKLNIDFANLKLEISGDKEWNNFFLQGKSGVANIFVNGEHTKRIKNIGAISGDSIYLKTSHTISEPSPLRDFRYYERPTSESEMLEIFKNYYQDLSYINQLEIYASNAANMFPTHF